MTEQQSNPLQQALASAMLERFPDATIKKIDRDNTLDIHIPKIHPPPPLRAKSTHVFFTTTKAGISIGWVCRDKDSVEYVLDCSVGLERFTHGIRPEGNPKYDNIAAAIDAAEQMIRRIYNAAWNEDSEETEDDATESSGSILSVDQILAQLQQKPLSASTTPRIKVATRLATGDAPYTLSFRAWVGAPSEDEPLEFFSREYATLDDAKSAFFQTSFEWDEGEWEGNMIHVSFRWPPLIEYDGEVVAKCEMIDPDEDDFEWIDTK